MFTKSIYLIKLREFIRTNENVYKVGRSENPIIRLKSYPKNSEVKFIIACDECVIVEKLIINNLKKNFIHCENYGNEYFKGNELEIIKKIINTINIHQIELNKVKTIDKYNSIKNNNKDIIIKDKIDDKDIVIDNKLDNNDIIIENKLDNEDVVKKDNLINKKIKKIKIIQNNIKEIQNSLINTNTLKSVAIKSASIKSDNVIFKCDKCDQTYESNSGLWKHNKKNHNVSKKITTLKCQFCDKILSDRICKWRHEKICNNKSNTVLSYEINKMVTKLTDEVRELNINIKRKN
jgi:hypothetical protein